jgi:transcription elongation GreA/GreB family factor
MSRAFTKEQDDAPEPPPIKLVRLLPYAATPARYAELQAMADERALDAVVIPPPEDRSRVAFGAIVSLSGIAAAPASYTIVDDEDANIRAGKLGRSSPLAQAVIGAHVGDTVTWHRPIGDAKVKIETLRYEG